MSAAQNFSDIGFPVPRGPAPPAFRAGVDWRAYQLSSLNVAYGQEANIQFTLGGVVWPGSVITATAYSIDREQYREYFWIDRQKNLNLPWPPDRSLEAEAAPLIRPAQMVIPYGLDVSVQPIASTCVVNNFLVPFAFWPGAPDNLAQCHWHITETPGPPRFSGEAPAGEAEFLDDLHDNWLDTPRRNSSHPIPVELEGQWQEVIPFQFVGGKAAPEWQSVNATVNGSQRYRIVRYVWQTYRDAPENPQPVETNVRRVRIGIRAPGQALSTIEWVEKILPDQSPLILEIRTLVPPSTHSWTVYCETWLPNRPTLARVRFGTASCSIINVARSLAWHDRAVWTRVGSNNAPVVRMRGRTVRIPDRPSRPNIDDNGIVNLDSNWRFAYNQGFPGRIVSGMQEVRCADPVWIIADVLTRSVYDYDPNTQIDWESFLVAGIANDIPVNVALNPQPNPLETLAPILAQTGLRLHQREGVWQFRQGLRMLLGSRQITDPIVTQTPLVRTPRTVQVTWGETGFAEIERTQFQTTDQPQPVPTASGVDILPWTKEDTDAIRSGREALWPRQDPTVQVSVGPWGQLLEPGDTVAVEPNAPAIVGKEEGFLGDDALTLTLSTPQSTLRRVLYATGKNSVSEPVPVEELPNGTLRALAGPGQEPVLRSAIVADTVREWEVLSVRKRSSLQWDLVLEAAPDPARQRWIEDGDEGCQLMDSWTRVMNDWPLLDSCVGFA